MTKSNGVALLVGAGDAIGAAVAQRFAKDGTRSASRGAMPPSRRGLSIR
jgi:NAD(P)-dependent dehydrogenase (short-subunit alcohol dehydrogenase family)